MRIVTESFLIERAIGIVFEWGLCVKRLQVKLWRWKIIIVFSRYS